MNDFDSYEDLEPVDAEAEEHLEELFDDYEDLALAILLLEAFAAP